MIHKFDFLLVRPVFVGDVEEFSATIQYLHTNNSCSNLDLAEAEGSPVACGDAIVSGMGIVNGIVSTITTIAYKCMLNQPDRLSQKGYTVTRED